MVATPEFTTASVTVTLDTTGQHTLSWNEALALQSTPDEQLPPGACNLYLFPAVDGTPTNGKLLEVLKSLLLAIATDESCNFFDLPDAVGAFPIHAVTVANTDQAVIMSQELVSARPNLLTQVHAKHRAGFPLFTGESCLHICAVNKREDLLLRMVSIAAEKLSKDEASALFQSQAEGVFFNEMPMRFYGGTPLSYACVFDLRHAVRAMLDTGLVDLNDRTQACKITGFLPIHSVVANGNTHCFEWMTGELPEKLRADRKARSSVGRMVNLNVHALEPVQLAAKLGDHSLVKHILRKQCTILWIWGPVTQHSMNLECIDSAGEGGGDIMELVARPDASTETRELLLDTFMLGFVHKLFREKWNGYGWKLHYARLVLDFAVTAMLILLAFWLKEYPEQQQSMAPLVYTILVLMVVLIEEELRCAYLWWLNNQGLGDAKLTFRQMMLGSIEFMKSHGVLLLFAAYLFTFVSCILVLTSAVAALPPDYQPDVTDDTGMSRRVLKGGGGESVSLGDESVAGMYYVGDKSSAGGATWLTLSMAIFLMMPYCAMTSFVPFETLNIFLLSMIKMLKSELPIFMILFVFFMADFFMTLYILYPRSGSVYLPQVLPFNKPYNGVLSLFELAFTGSPSVINLDASFADLSGFQVFDFGLWLFIYLIFIILSLILLLNLLIAMLSFTFEAVRDQCTLQYRTAFAQRMMRLELLAAAFGMQINVGEAKGDGSYAFDFRSVVSADGDSKAAGGDDPFSIPDGGPLARIEAKLERIEGKMAAEEAKASKVTTL